MAAGRSWVPFPTIGYEGLCLYFFEFSYPQVVFKTISKIILVHQRSTFPVWNLANAQCSHLLGSSSDAPRTLGATRLYTTCMWLRGVGVISTVWPSHVGRTQTPPRTCNVLSYASVFLEPVYLKNSLFHEGCCRCAPHTFLS